MKLKSSIFLITLGLINISANATSTLSTSCPNRYVAEVVSIEEGSSVALMPKIAIEFRILETRKGEKLETKNIEVIKDGPDKFVLGQSYILETNENWLCALKPTS